MRKRYRVKFSRACAPYLPGDRAGFQKAKAEAYVTQGFGSYDPPLKEQERLFLQLEKEPSNRMLETKGKRRGSTDTSNEE